MDSAAIDIIGNEEEANLAALKMARGGDLVLILADHVARAWKQIIYFEPDADVVASAPSSKTVDIPDEFFGAFHFDEDMELIRDERGVRIARETED